MRRVRRSLKGCFPSRVTSSSFRIPIVFFLPTAFFRLVVPVDWIPVVRLPSENLTTVL